MSRVRCALHNVDDVETKSLFDVLKITNILYLLILLSTNLFCENLFHENVLRTFWRIRRNWNSTSKVNKSAQQESMADYGRFKRVTIQTPLSCDYFFHFNWHQSLPLKFEHFTV